MQTLNGGDKSMTREEEIVDLARSQHQEEGQIEIDDGAPISEGEDNGCYVQAWVWVDFAGSKFDKEADHRTEEEIAAQAREDDELLRKLMEE